MKKCFGALWNTISDCAGKSEPVSATAHGAGGAHNSDLNLFNNIAAIRLKRGVVPLFQKKAKPELKAPAPQEMVKTYTDMDKDSFHSAFDSFGSVLPQSPLDQFDPFLLFCILIISVLPIICLFWRRTWGSKKRRREDQIVQNQNEA